MTHGRPDWVRTTTLQDIRDVFGNIPQVNMGEVAARLGSAKIFERRGDVVFVDDFESSTLKWAITGSALAENYSGVRSNVSAQSKNFSMKLNAGTVQSSYVKASHTHYLPVQKRMGVEFSFTLSPNVIDIYNSMELQTKTMKYVATFDYSPASSLFSIRKSDGNYVNIDSALVLAKDDKLFHTWKMVFDIETGMWVRGYIDNLEYDLSEYGLYLVGGSYTPQMSLQIQVWNFVVVSQYSYIDNVIFTQNEP